MVLWIDQNDVATKLFERVFKDKGFSFYTLTSVGDFSYLIADLNPSLIVLDAQTALKDLAALERQYFETNAFSGKPVLLVDPLPGLEFIQNVIGELKRPIDPFTLPEILNKMTL